MLAHSSVNMTSNTTMHSRTTYFYLVNLSVRSLSVCFPFVRLNQPLLPSLTRAIKTLIHSPAAFPLDFPKGMWLQSSWELLQKPRLLALITANHKGHSASLLRIKAAAGQLCRLGWCSPPSRQRHVIAFLLLLIAIKSSSLQLFLSSKSVSSDLGCQNDTSLLKKKLLTICSYTGSMWSLLCLPVHPACSRRCSRCLTSVDWKRLRYYSISETTSPEQASVM